MRGGSLRLFKFLFLFGGWWSLLTKTAKRRSKFGDEAKDELKFTADHVTFGLLSNIYIELLNK